MADRLARLRHRWVVAAAREQVPDRQQCDGDREARLRVAEVAGCPHEPRRVRIVLGSAVERQVEEPGILGRREPLALLAAALDQVEQDAAPVTVGIGADQRTVDGKVGRSP